MSNVNPYDYRQTIAEQCRAYATSSLCLLGATGCLTGLLNTKQPNLQLLLATVGTTVAIAGRVVGKTGQERAMIANDWQDVSDAARTSNLAVQLAPRSIKASQALNGSSGSTKAIEAFNWNLLAQERDKYPHLMLLGSTGDGKSVLAENLGGLLGGVKLGAIPHWESGEYESLDIIVGEECNYGISALPYADEPERGKTQNDEPEVDLKDIMSRRVKPSITQFLRAIYNEMVDRFQLDPVTRKRPQREPITIILDEYLSYSKIKGVNDIVKRLIREARKVGIRLVLLVQGNTVASLGWEGEGDLRENLTYIYLKEFAVDQIKVLRNNSKDDENKGYYNAILAKLAADNYPTVVEKTYAIRPPIGAFVTSKIQSNESDYPVEPQQPRSIPVSTLPNFSNSIVVNNTAHASVSFDEEYNLRKALWNAAKSAVELGKNKSEIIKTVWGYKSERYTKGTKLWQQLEKEFGNIPNSQDGD